MRKMQYNGSHKHMNHGKIGGDSRHNALRITAIVLLFIVGLNALAAGYSFIVEPSGSGVGISTGYLREAGPFTNYFIPGLILFTVIGVGSVAIAVLTIMKAAHYPFLILAQGCILVGWIAIQLMLVTAFHPLHLIITLIGFILAAVAWIMIRQRVAW